MRPIGAILFLMIYLSANTEFHQVLKLPALFTHYIEHRQHNKSMHFIEFIVLHYSSEDVKDVDYERDLQLPFKNNHCVEAFISITTPPEKLPELTIPLATLSRKILIPTLPFGSSSFLFSIWQPPKA